eukprot:gb/GEZJ01003663.1/.p1 GENE.gb/GEZJ01003663.1/~~gb/GEZJ01003663.1/.p1  ORF type:complete len:102 (+),score=6.50 gb/GEZJ01003663.1/:699-1004(+)
MTGAEIQRLNSSGWKSAVASSEGEVKSENCGYPIWSPLRSHTIALLKSATQRTVTLSYHARSAAKGERTFIKEASNAAAQAREREGGASDGCGVTTFRYFL